MPECLTYAFHKRTYAPPCGRCSACLTVAPIEAPYIPPVDISVGDSGLATGDQVSVAPTDEPPGDEQAEDMPADMPPVEIISAGGGWYELVAGGEVLDRTRGKDAAGARATELSAT